MNTTDFQNLAKDLNELLIQQKMNNSVYKRPQLIALLKKAHIRTAQSFVTLFMKTFMTSLNKNGEYVFKSKAPIYFMDLKKIYDINSNYNRVYQRKRRALKKEEIEVPVTETNEIDKAIALLKENGYKVLKPIIEYKEL